jgi:hypothetical protein
LQNAFFRAPRESKLQMITFRKNKFSSVEKTGTVAAMTKPKKHRPHGFWYQHSLSIVSVAVLTLWIILYCFADPNTHIGAFLGNAIADWSGSVVIIIGTKFLVEYHSAESRQVNYRLKNPFFDFVWKHSLLIFLGITGIGWTILFSKMEVNGKWGQVVGNIVSEWVQMAGLVFLTKKLIEKGSKESNRDK